MMKTMRAAAVMAVLMASSVAQASGATQVKAANFAHPVPSDYTECMKIDRLGDGSPFDCEWALHAKVKMPVAHSATKTMPAAGIKTTAPSLVARTNWTAGVKEKAAYQACLKFDRQGEELYIDCDNLLRQPEANSTAAAAAVPAQSALPPASPAKFTPSAGALAARDSCQKMNMEHSGEEPYFDCDNLARPSVADQAAPTKLAAVTPARREPNYFGEGCESGCVLSVQ